MMRLHKHGKPGFTLIEVFVVIAILAMLGTLGWQATKLVKSRELNKKAEIEIALLENGLNTYRQDYGDVLPAGEGDAWSAHSLYSALFCDADNDGEPDRDPQTNEPKIPYCEAIEPIESDKHAAEVPNGKIIATKRPISTPGKKKKKYYILKDPWGNPYRYRLGYEMKDENNRPGKGINSDFDIFSCGPDGLGDGMDNLNDNEDNVSNVRSWN